MSEALAMEAMTLTFGQVLMLGGSWLLLLAAAVTFGWLYWITRRRYKDFVDRTMDAVMKTMSPRRKAPPPPTSMGWKPKNR